MCIGWLKIESVADMQLQVDVMQVRIRTLRLKVNTKYVDLNKRKGLKLIHTYLIYKSIYGSFTISSSIRYGTFESYFSEAI